MKDFTVYKLDKRHKGHVLFSHYIVPTWSVRLEDKLRFFEWRNWCWATWGPAMEREEAISFGSNYYSVGRWCWHTGDGQKRLYFQTEKELNWFVLTWST